MKEELGCPSLPGPSDEFSPFLTYPHLLPLHCLDLINKSYTAILSG